MNIFGNAINCLENDSVTATAIGVIVLNDFISIELYKSTNVVSTSSSFALGNYYRIRLCS